MLSSYLPPGLALVNYVLWALAVPIACLCGFLYYRKNRNGYWGTTIGSAAVGTTFITAVVLFVVLMVTNVVAHDGGEGRKVHAVVSEQLKIAALQDNPGTNGAHSGSFLFASGYMTGQINYSYYLEEADGGLIPVTRPEGDVRILRSNEESPTVYRYRTEFDDPKLNYWFYPPQISWREDIVVPPDAIVLDYTSDLK